MTTTIDLTEAERMFESATEMVAQRRKAIADAVSSPLAASQIAELVNKLAEAEGAFKAIERMMRTLSYNERVEAADRLSVRDGLVERLLRGADDGWSGRGNDVKRAEFDGFRAQVERLLWSF